MYKVDLNNTGRDNVDKNGTEYNSSSQMTISV